MKPKKYLGILMGLLTMEFILGMLVNLFGVDPGEGESPTIIKMAFATHGIIGLLLLIGGIWMAIFGLKATDKIVKKMALTAALGILVAFACGIATVSLQGPAREYASFAMAMGFLIAVSTTGRLISRV
ncbi:hypothetical protein HYS00_00325 [Candidatus Microgenomates bacterium]|nr:hypothetical protein [Candidatus Microgenomates bacterium]